MHVGQHTEKILHYVQNDERFGEFFGWARLT